MRKLIFLLLLIAFVPFASASKFAVERLDGGVSIVHYVDGAKDSLSEVLDDLGLSGQPVVLIEDSDLPDREDRAFWELNPVPIGKKIKVNQVKKQAKIDAEAAEDAEIDAILAELKITKDQLKKLKKVLKD